METKVLLTNKNSIWGIITNPVAANVYRHILSFGNDHMRDEYINHNLMKNGKTYQAELLKQPSISLTTIDSLKSTFKVHPRTYPDETYDTLMNKDYAIITEFGKTKFYSLTATLQGQWISYVAELDIFFTYDIKSMFNTNKTQIKRGMLDRYFKNNDNHLLPIHLQVDVGNDDEIMNRDIPFLNSESIGESMEGLPQKSGRMLSCNTDLNDLNIQWLHIDETILDQEKEQEGVELFKKIEWQIYFNTSDTNKNYDPYVLSNRYQEKNSLPYMIMMTANSNKFQFEFNNDDKNKSGILSNGIPNKITTAADANLSGLSFSILQFPFFQEFYGMRYHDKDANPLKIVYDDMNDIYTVHLKKEFIEKNYKTIRYDQDNNYPNVDVKHNFYIIKKWDNKKSTTLTNPYAYIYNPMDKYKTVDTSIKHDKYKYELKSYFHPYRFWTLYGGDSELIIQPQYIFNGKKILLKGSNDFSIITNGYWIKPDSYKKGVNIANDLYNSDVENMLIISSNYALPTKQDAWNEYIIRNKSQRKTSRDRIDYDKTMGIVKGALSIAGGALATGLSGGGKVAAGGAAAIAHGGMSIFEAHKNAEFSLKQMASQETDIKNTPSEINYNSNSLIANMSRTTIKPYLIESKLAEHIAIKVREYFYMFGYNLNERLYNINDYLKNRFYFNYIQATETFENIKLQLSTQIKQLIDSTLANGLHIWHIRTNNSTNRVKNFEFENWEMSLI